MRETRRSVRKRRERLGNRMALVGVTFVVISLAVVVNSIDEVWNYFDEEGIDLEGQDKEEIVDAPEVFDIGDGRYLIVES